MFNIHFAGDRFLFYLLLLYLLQYWILRSCSTCSSCLTVGLKQGRKRELDCNLSLTVTHNIYYIHTVLSLPCFSPTIAGLALTLTPLVLGRRAEADRESMAYIYSIIGREWHIYTVYIM